MWLPAFITLILLWSVEARPILDCRADVAFVLDGSGSVGQRNWDLTLTFVRDFAQLATYGPNKTLSGVVSFGDDAALNIRLSDHATADSFTAALQSVAYTDGATNTAAGLRTARTQLFSPAAGNRADAPDLLILVTDGQPTVEQERTLPEVALIRDAGITLLVVGIGRDVSRSELLKMAGNNPDFVFTADDFEQLVRSVGQVLSSACQMLTSVTPTISTASTRSKSPQPDSTSTSFVPTKSLNATSTTNAAPIINSSTKKASEGSVTTTPNANSFSLSPKSESSSTPTAATTTLESKVTKKDSLISTTTSSNSANIVSGVPSTTKDTKGLGSSTVNTNTGSITLDDINVKSTKSAVTLTSPTMSTKTATLPTTTTDSSSVNDKSSTVSGQASNTTNKSVTGSGSTSATTQAPSTPSPTSASTTTRATPSTATSSKATPSTVTPSKATPSQATPSQATPTKATPSQATPSKATPSQGTPSPAGSTTSSTLTSTVSPEPVTIPCDKTDLVMLLDSSGSLKSKENWNRIKDVATVVATSLLLDAEHTQIGIVIFSSEAFLTVQLSTMTDRKEIAAKLDNVEWTSQMTNISGALRMARTRMFNTNYDRKDAKNVILIMTDGASNRDTAVTLTEANKLKNSGVSIFTVGLGDNVDLRELRGISSEPSRFYLMLVPDTAQLVEMTETIFRRTCIDREPLLPAQQPVSGCPYDEVFVMHDVSGDSFSQMLTVIRDFANVIDLTTHRIGIIGQSAQEAIRFYPTEYVRRTDFLTFLESLNPIGPSSSVPATFRTGLEILSQARDTGVPSLKTITILAPAGINPAELGELEGDARKARESGILVYVVYGAMPKEELTNIASEPSQLFLIPIDSSSPTMVDVCLTHQPGTVGCDFVDTEGGPSLCDMTQSTDDTFDWTIQTGRTPSLHTGPGVAVSGQYYVYIEASSPRQPGDKADLVLPPAAWNGPSCLSFFYHMRGWHIGELQVILRSSARVGDEIVWYLSGHQSDDWLMGMVTVAISTNDKIIFQAIRGGAFSGDIALDHVRLSSGQCTPATGDFIGLQLP